MRIGSWAVGLLALVLGYGTAWGACAPGQSRDCVLDLGVVPQISQQIVAGSHTAARAKRLPTAEPQTPYTGPTLGISNTVHRAPEIGYRWAIN